MAEEKQKKEDDICPICNREFTAKVVLKCGHSLCFRCAVSWSEQKDTCPMCRKPFLQKDPTIPDPPVELKSYISDADSYSGSEDDDYFRQALNVIVATFTPLPECKICHQPTVEHSGEICPGCRCPFCNNPKLAHYLACAEHKDRYCQQMCFSSHPSRCVTEQCPKTPLEGQIYCRKHCKRHMVGPYDRSLLCQSEDCRQFKSSGDFCRIHSKYEKQMYFPVETGFHTARVIYTQLKLPKLLRDACLHPKHPIENNLEVAIIAAKFETNDWKSHTDELVLPNITEDCSISDWNKIQKDNKLSLSIFSFHNIPENLERLKRGLPKDGKPADMKEILSAMETFNHYRFNHIYQEHINLLLIFLEEYGGETGKFYPFSFRKLFGIPTICERCICWFKKKKDYAKHIKTCMGNRKPPARLK